MKSLKIYSFAVAIVFGLSLIALGAPVDETETATEIPDEGNNDTNKEIYVVKIRTYKVRILADIPNNDTTTINGAVTSQKIDLTFYNAKSNDSHLDLGTVPIPLQSNGTSDQVTGIAPVNIGSVENVQDILGNLPFSAAILNITNSDTSYVKVNRENLTEEDNQIRLADNADLAKLPILNNVLLPTSFSDNSNITENDQ